MFELSRRRCLVLVAAVAGASARAEPLVPADAAALRELIEAQLAAFRADDAARAFAFASPGIQSQFGSAERFMQMVREGYPMVYRAASARFLPPVAEGGAVLQKVMLTDGQGTPWLAIYRLERQGDASWRIAGCVAGRVAGESV